MDRTREFYSVVEATNIPQQAAHPEGGWLDEVSKKIAEAEKNMASMEKTSTKTYDSLGKFQRLSSAAEEGLRMLSVSMGEVEERPEDGPLLKSGVAAVIRRKYASLSLRLSTALKQKRDSLKRDEQKRGAAAQRELEERALHAEPPGRASHPQQRQSALTQEMIVREESSQVRQREMQSIEAHINELGKIVSDVSMHISMQGEKLQRIDEIFSESRTRLKRGGVEVKKTFEHIVGRRRTLFTFFGFLFAILLLRLYISKA